MIEAVKGKIDFSRVLFIGVQHIVATTASLFEAMIRLGADPEKMYFIGKDYKYNPKDFKGWEFLNLN